MFWFAQKRGFVFFGGGLAFFIFSFNFFDSLFCDILYGAFSFAMGEYSVFNRPPCETSVLIADCGAACGEKRESSRARERERERDVRTDPCT